MRILCRLCGRVFHQITCTHLAKVHRMTMEEYRKSSPGCEVCSDGVRKKMSVANRNRGMHLSAETREKISRAALGHKRNLGHHHSPETREKIRRAALRNKNHFGHHHSPETRAEISAAAIRRMAEGRYKAKVSKLETLFADRYLTPLGLPFERQFFFKDLRTLIGYHPFDFAIPSKRLLIEVDGCFWHACPLCYPQRLPSQRDEEVSLAAVEMGWHLLRIWEHEIRGNVLNLDVYRRLDQTHETEVTHAEQRS